MDLPSCKHTPDLKASARSKNGSQNRLLKRLPPAIMRRLRRNLKEVALTPGFPLHEPRRPLRYVYFPETGTASIRTVLKDGTETEVATVGREGLVGLAVFLGAKSTPRRTVWQMQGTAMRMDAAVLRHETRCGGAFSDVLHLYAQALFTQLSQLATCSRFHTIKQRCCCWLLMTHDRVEGNEFALTHEFLAQMLGTRRSGVTVIAGTLQRAGLIEYRRGHVTIRNRAALEKAACECYAIVRGEFDRLLG